MPTLRPTREADLRDEESKSPVQAGDRHVANPQQVLEAVLTNQEIDRDGFRLSLWAGYYTSPVFAEIERRFGLYRDENNVLFALSIYGQLTASSISVFLGRPKNSISRAVDRLIRKELIRTDTDPTDRRRVLLTVEPAGVALHKCTLAIHKEREALMLDNLTEEERAILDVLLAKMMQNAETWMQPL